MTRHAFVIGHPIAHSRSPLVHRHWLETYGIDGTYEAIDVSPKDLAAHFSRLRSGEFVGGNVTIPLKLDAARFCSDLDANAETLGAVNTLIADKRIIHGSNTDHLGFLGNLDQNAPGWENELEIAVVIGAGGASRAVLLALARRGIEHIALLNRSPAKARLLAEELGPKMGLEIDHGGLADFERFAEGAGLVVNTSAVGMHGTRFDNLSLSDLPENALVTDIVYTPLITPLLADAAARGLKTLDGLGMLLHQAVPGFEAWFGVRPEVTGALRTKVLASLAAEKDWQS
jgi:shikimate dehydrogenase